MDESSEYGTSKHVVFFRLLPEQGQVLNQTAYVRSDLKQKEIKMTNKKQSTEYCEFQPVSHTTTNTVYLTTIKVMLESAVDDKKIKALFGSSDRDNGVL